MEKDIENTNIDAYNSEYLEDEFLLEEDENYVITSERYENDKMWRKLIDQILAGNVIPVIGDDLLLMNSTPSKILLNNLKHKFKIPKELNISTFSDLAYNQYYIEKSETKNIYEDAKKFITPINNEERVKISDNLKRLLSIKQFPFVITTSVFPMVETIMRTVWKDQLTVRIFNNQNNKNGISDIEKPSDIKKPTVFYMFGKINIGNDPYVLKDIDMLNFVSSWLSQVPRVRPNNLCEALRGKYLLMLGNNYNNWLFRFIWYSIQKVGNGSSTNENTQNQNTNVFNDGLLVYDNNMDDSLKNFLTRLGLSTKENTGKVIEEIETRLNEELTKRNNKFAKPENDADVFISYARSDGKLIAEKLYECLTSRNIKVWYDKFNLLGGDNFINEIDKAIKTAKYFIPIISPNIIEEKNERHVYRHEWSVAGVNATYLGRTFIIPVAHEDVDFYNASLPDCITKNNSLQYNDNLILDKLLQDLEITMDQI